MVKPWIVVDQYMKHFKTGISKDIHKFASDVVFAKSRYIFIRRQGKKQIGYCTNCHKEFETHGLKHQTDVIPYRCSHGIPMSRPEPVKCPKCGSICKVKAAGISRKWLVDRGYFLYYQKSAIDSNVITARGFCAFRNYSGDYHNVQTQYMEVTRYVFEMGGGKMFENFGYYWNGTFHCEDTPWYQRGKVFTDVRHVNAMGGSYSRDSIKNAVAGTQFQYSGWEEYNHTDMVTFFDLYSRYPSIEYLTKFGFKNVVRAKLENDYTFGAINWRGKTVFKVLRLTKSDLKEIKQNNIKVDCYFLHLLQLARRYDPSITPAYIADLHINSKYREECLTQMLQHLTFRKAANYIQKQRKLKSRLFHDGNSVLGAWADYIRDCQRLNLDIKDHRVVFPRDLYAAHQNTIKQIRIKSDEELRRQVEERAKTLKKYHYKNNEFLIRPAQDADELIAEGKVLNHCVGTYAKAHASGQTTILFVRKISDPDTPFFTVEIRGIDVVQIRGKNNKPADKEVLAFVDAFKEAKLMPKTNLKKSA